MRVCGLAGWSNSGKTTLMERLLPHIIDRGLSVSTVKHAHHDFDIDQPGKDSYRHRIAGAREVMISSANRWALMHENSDASELTLDDLIGHMRPVDLVLVEGFKAEALDKLEVHRPTTGKALLCEADPRIVAVASDAALPDVGLPVLDLDDAPAITDFIIGHCGLRARRRGAV